MHSAIEFGAREDEGEYEENSDDDEGAWCGQFAGCTSLTAVPAPAEVAARFPGDMFEGCGTAPPTLLAAAIADLELWCYWSRQTHRRCSLVAKDKLLAIMLVCVRLDLEPESGQQLPALPSEIWCCVLEFIPQHALAAVL